MRPLICIFWLALCVAAPAAQFKIGAHTFTLPDGFEIELVAGTNLLLRPIEADFDEHGRLYVTESSGSNDNVQKQLAEKPHRVVRLEDTNADGRFDKALTFADKLMLPQGAMWRDGSLYVAAPPSIWKLTDTNNDGVADERLEWFKGETLTGCANDLHGPYEGPDGFIYWCKGAFAKQTYTLPNGKALTTRASHIFRARPDGTGVEPVMTGGIDNPVGLAWQPDGELFLSGTFFQHPAGGNRDGLIHVLYGGVYGKDHDVLEGHVRTGELLPMMTHLGPAAPAGLMCYESDVFGGEFQFNLFTACFNLHKVTRHVVEGHGATARTTDSDFLVSDNMDFHPTDVLEDADGSLIIIDTGGWYKLCCPTSQLHKPDVAGGIYRVRRRGAPKLNDPRGLAVAWSSASPQKLTELLQDNRPAVRTRAIRELGRRGDAAIPALKNAIEDRHRALPAVWALARTDSPRAREAVRAASNSEHGIARIAGMHMASVWRDDGALREAIAGLKSGSPHLARRAVEALGSFGDHRATAELLSATSHLPDRAFEHALVYALIEIGDAAGVSAALRSDDPLKRRVALLALDQMPGGQLQPEQVLPLLSSTNALLKETAWWIALRHADWSEALAKFFEQHLQSVPAEPERRVELQQNLERLARTAAIQSVLARTLAQGSPGARVIALRTLARSGVKDWPTNWIPALIECLGSADAHVVSNAVATVRALPSPKTDAEALAIPLITIAERLDVPPDLRVAAAAAVPGGIQRLSEPLYSRLLGTMLLDPSSRVRMDAATALARARLSNARLGELAARARRIGPMELPHVLPAFSKSTNEAIGLRLLDSLSAGKTAVRPDLLRSVLTNYPANVRQRAEEWLATFNTDAESQNKHLDELLKSLSGGDIRRGQALFNSARTACSTCHAIGYLGGNLGPDLTRIGQVRSERDLLEAIVYPNASFVRSYEPVVVVTTSGEEFSGVLRKDAPDEVVLATGPGAEQRFARRDIAELRPGTVSVMPSGLAEQLNQQELADLMAFLKATRW